MRCRSLSKSISLQILEKDIIIEALFKEPIEIQPELRVHGKRYCFSHTNETDDESLSIKQERTQVELVKKDFNVDEEMCQRMVQELAARASNFVPMNGAMKTIDGADREVD